MLTERAKEIVKGVEVKMGDTVAYLEEDLKTYRVGKANPSILNNVSVNYYGTDTPVSQVASINVPDARTIIIQPWERSLIPAIEKAIMAANLGFTPQNNGEIIRCPIPPLTEERRKDLIKKAKATGENAKVAVRNARREGVDALKKAQKAGEFSEDVQKEGEDEIQKVTDAKVKAIDAIVAAKEKEILTV
ncbi:MAG: ribosome recycling factor [Bacteroidales bacterium]|nr:ribosome recycling factor [Bacteroidales bacterium]